MGTEADRSTVGDYVTLVRGKTYRGSLVGEPGPALLGLGSIEPGGGFRPDYKTYGGECPPELMLSPGNLYAALKGATKDGTMIGSVARVPESVESGRLTQDTVRLRFRHDNPEDVSYLYWTLRTPQYREYCAAHAIGSANVALSREDFLGYPVPAPTPDRRTIAALLDAIEARIQIGREMSETLEGVARAIFKSWFVDFDPVHAKVEGRDPGLPKPLADLFPDRLTGSNVGEIPQGWRLATLEDFAELNPESWTKATRPNLIDYVDLTNTKWGRIEQIVHYDANDAPSRAQRVLRAGDTIVGTVRPGNGSYARINYDGLTGSTGFAVLRPCDAAHSGFVYLASTAKANIDRLAHLADGAAYPSVRPSAVSATEVAKPGPEVTTAFNKIVEPLMTKIALSADEAGTLGALRDTLLPKLVSGEIRLDVASA